LNSRNVPGKVVQSDKLRQTNCNEFLDNFVMKKARTKPLTVYCVMFSLTCFDDCRQQLQPFGCV